MIKCDNCECTETYVKDYLHKYSFKGQYIEFVLKRRFCKSCDNLVYDSELDNAAGEKAIEVYNEKFGIPGEKIKELRKGFNLSQELFSRIIGCAKKTLVSYELGTSIPNDIYAIIIKSLIVKPETILTFVNVNKQSFSEDEYQKIMTNIKNYLKNNINDKNEPLNEFNGYTNLNQDKVRSMILYFSEEGILKTKLLKEMFYADFLYYKNTGKSITGLEYAKLNFGPVPNNYEEIISDMMQDKLINYEIEYKDDYENHIIKNASDLKNDSLSKDELEIIMRVKNYFAKFNSSKIVDFSHEEKAFLETKYYEKISYDYAFDIERNI